MDNRKNLIVDILTGVLLTGSATCGGLILHYMTTKEGQYRLFRGKVIQSSQYPDRFHVEDPQTGQKSPPVSIQSISGTESKIWVLTPRYYAHMPNGPPRDVNLQILCFCLAGIGLCLLVTSGWRLVLVSSRNDNRHRETHSVLIGIVGVIHIVIGLVVALVILKHSATAYVPVEGTAEDAGNGRFRVRFANDEEPTTHDMDVPKDNPPVFGKPYTVYRVDLPKTSLRGEQGADVYLMILTVFTFVSFLLCVVLIGYQRLTHSEEDDAIPPPPLQTTRVTPYRPVGWPNQPTGLSRFEPVEGIVATDIPGEPVTGVPVRYP
jgi:hypothetical protein